MEPDCDSVLMKSEIVQVLLVEQLAEDAHVVLAGLETVAELLAHESSFGHALDGREIAL